MSKYELTSRGFLFNNVINSKSNLRHLNKNVEAEIKYLGGKKKEKIGVFGQENCQNRENALYGENCQNRENVPNGENCQNRENVPNGENCQNRENVPYGEISQNGENSQNGEKSLNTKNYERSGKKYNMSNDDEMTISNLQNFTNEGNYTGNENISVKELSDEEVNSENEYNRKIKKNKNSSLNLKELYSYNVNNIDDDISKAKGAQNSSQNDKIYEQFYNKYQEQHTNQNDNLCANLSTRKISYSVDEWISKLLKCELLNIDEIKLMCTLLIDILKEEPNCIQVSAPVTVAGDIHGQFFDLLELFHIGGLPPDVSYLFLGDYVDRGYYSCECFCLVACLKIKYPNKVTILRGNHESRQITKVYGFYDECIRKYNNDNNAWKYLTDAFDYLPLTAIINKEIFCDHGGISPYVQTIQEINSLNRFKEIPQEGAICDLLWSDPAGPEDDVSEGWKVSPRGAGVLFNEDKTNTFLHMNNLSCICRAHQLVQEGFQWMHNDKVVTIFSAPNYCYRCGNSASLMIVDEFMEKDFITFNTAPLRANAQALRRSVHYML
ncbi:protein phosphatase-beta [Plasmodium brasilianum]|uniref:Protein phosphatase-beta n=1 Tax=Plasmodium brasilianum TaxID=5824 RepID=A0ACB9YD24_PLABR|nr:protein phosphatase-beta [Plasmodium brasilianum]